MDKHQRISVIASSSNSSSMSSSKQYDVFLSFRGEDTRKNFTSHLYKSLNEKKVQTYIDDRLEKGDEISSTLTKAIEGSRVSIVIFSENYASSKWCLGELIKIMECKKERGQIVIPIFYNIDPSHVRKQTGSYKQAFAKHEGEEEPRCNKWKIVLTEAANLAGWDSQTYRTDTELIKDIVGDVLRKLPPRYANQLKGLVGIEQRYKQIESLLKNGSNEVRTLGIWGMGGIGKTTLARALYGQLSHKFEGGCFLSNVSEKSNKLKDLRDNSEIHKLRGKKVFIVLDDMDTSEQLDKLIVDSDFFGRGSRVIVTTRNKQILSVVDDIYQVEELSFHKSLELFCLTVFGEHHPNDGYEDLSRRVISYCQGIPLALKVLGASLRSKHKEFWESELRKLKKIPNKEIHKVLKLSYDDLDRSQKDIFLDIACFFKGRKRDRVTRLLEAFDFFPASGIEILLDKALITISAINQIEMHDLIQEMGREIVHQESKDPGRRTRLWRVEEVVDVLKNNKGTDVVEGIILDMSKLNEDLYLSSDSLALMTNLRYLRIDEWNWSGYSNNNGTVSILYLLNGLKSLSDRLRYLHWDRCYLESLPPNICAEQLVKLSMKRSKLKKLWDGVKNLVNLKEFDLSYSDNLIEIPDLSKAKKLESVYLSCCKSLPQLHIHSKSLREMVLNGCSSLTELSATSEEMTTLNLSSTNICELKSSIGHLLSLQSLYLSETNVESLPSNTKNLEMLTILWLNDCKKLISLPELPLSLEELLLHDCLKLVSLPELPPFLSKLRAYSCISLETEITERLVLQHLLQSHIPYTHIHSQYLNDPEYCDYEYCVHENSLKKHEYFIFPGDHVTDKCGFRATENSITIPYLPKSDLWGFVYCIILSKGSIILDCNVWCSIYVDDIKVNCCNRWSSYYEHTTSDHVMFWYEDFYEFKFGRTSEVYGHFSNMRFIFGLEDDDDDEDTIKACGVFPVYETTSGLKLVTSSGKQISECESINSEQLLSASKRRRTSRGPE